MLRESLNKTPASHNRCYEKSPVSINPVGKSDSGEACPICLRHADLEQDHDHRTDLCRGRICSSCNHLVARFDRPIDEIRRFLDYLQHWAAQHAAGVGPSYTEYMRVAAPNYRRGHRAPRSRKAVA